MEILLGSLFISGSLGLFYKSISSNNTSESITEDLNKSINSSDYIFEKNDELCVITPTLTPHSTAPIPKNKINSVIPY